MTCGQQLIDEIRKLAAPGGPGAKTISLSAPDGVELSVDVTAADSMSCSCRELRLRVPALNGVAATVLKKWAEALCARVTYLLEQLGPLEIDSQGKQVLIPSKSPAKRAAP